MNLTPKFEIYHHLIN